jgi:tetratricopeptide (TPR) repeat protein
MAGLHRALSGIQFPLERGNSRVDSRGRERSLEAASADGEWLMGMPGGPKYRAICAGFVIVSASMVFLAGCQRISQYLYLHDYDSEISKATRAIELAQNDSQRAAAFAQRGSAIGEKARYSRAFKLISGAEHARMLEQALKDHSQAIALAPGSAELYYLRGRTYYSQATLGPLVPEEGPRAKPRLAAARADFSKAIELDPRSSQAYEMRGLAEEGTGDLDAAIADYTKLAELDPKSNFRLADAYCSRGSFYLREKKHDFAAADLEKSIEIGSSADACQCEPYNPLLAIYLIDKPDLARAREVVRRAHAARKWIAPDYLEKLK